MTPIPVDPRVVVYMRDGKVAAVASNVAGDLKVEVVDTNEAYGESTGNLPFDSANPHPQSDYVLASKS